MSLAPTFALVLGDERSHVILPGHGIETRLIHNLIDVAVNIIQGIYDLPHIGILISSNCRISQSMRFLTMLVRILITRDPVYIVSGKHRMGESEHDLRLVFVSLEQHY